MSLLLNVPYSEKDEAKQLGARWNPSLKKWYVEKQKDYPKFSKWILGNEEEAFVLCDHFYIVEGKHKCFKCHTQTNVIGFGVENFYNFFDDDDDSYEYWDDEIHIAPFIYGLPQSFYDYIKNNHNFYKGYSKTLGDYCYANHCQKCGMLQGNFFVFDEVDSPFMIEDEEQAAALTLYRIKLKNDLIVNMDLSIGSEDYMIGENAKLIELGFLDAL